jgi:hypothetical protein
VLDSLSGRHFKNPTSRPIDSSPPNEDVSIRFDSSKIMEAHFRAVIVNGCKIATHDLRAPKIVSAELTMPAFFWRLLTPSWLNLSG